MPDEPVGIERLVEFLDNALQNSEAEAVRSGTNYVEAESAAAEILKGAARQFGGDVTDPQWYAGATAVLSFLASYADKSLIGMATIGPFMEPLTHALARVYDFVSREGVRVFDERT